ncbi:MAG TPA: arylamine N-acetyltransferase [Pseudomonadota bacterium]|nr:arylamine N-acetyltransferase [Pseudomonadota bacterium]
MSADDPELAPLAPATVMAYLARLGVERPARLDLPALTRLQAAHLRAVPFHNLALLAAAGRAPGLPPVAAAVEGALRGHGGTCHVLSPPFVALLRSLGFEAHLAAASVTAAGDHLTAIVYLQGRRWLCDVANGHPYLRPFPLDGAAAGEQEQTAYGWRFRIEPLPVSESASTGSTHRVLRLLPDRTWKVVYALDPRRVHYASFARIIYEHHTRTGFGPFLTGLRAVRMTPERLLCLRDCWLERYGLGLVGRRRLPDARAVGAVLAQHFDLGGLPWEEALQALAPTTRQWWPGEPVAEPAGVEVTPAVPALRFLVSVGLTDRPGNLWALGQELLRDGLGSSAGQPPAAAILAFDNSGEAASRQDNQAAAAALSAAGLPTQIAEPRAVLRVRQRLAAAGLCADDQHAARLAIASNRMIQVGLLADFLRQSPRGPAPLPPHPEDGQGPIAVWMLDDDLRLVRLEQTAQGLVAVPLRNLRGTLDALYRRHPEVSVLVGGNTGCPPVPGFCFLQVQILDLIAHVARASRQDPQAPYRACPSPRHLPDYYYDTSDSGDAHLELAFDWEPSADSGDLPIRSALLAHLRAFPRVLYGQPVTRLLVHDPELPVGAATARGGNAVFFDLDALFSAPYPAIRLADGMVSRRGDTVWAHLATAVPGVTIHQAPFPLHHTRGAGDGSSPALVAAQTRSMRQFILAQVAGVVFSRLVAAKLAGHAIDPRELLAQRVARVRAAFAAAVQQIDSFSAANYEHRADLWWSNPRDPEVHEELARVASVLGELKAGLLTDELVTETELALTAEQLAASLGALDQTCERWRSLWA